MQQDGAGIVAHAILERWSLRRSLSPPWMGEADSVMWWPRPSRPVPSVWPERVSGGFSATQVEEQDDIQLRCFGFRCGRGRGLLRRGLDIRRGAAPARTLCLRGSDFAGSDFAAGSRDVSPPLWGRRPSARSERKLARSLFAASRFRCSARFLQRFLLSPPRPAAGRCARLPGAARLRPTSEISAAGDLLRLGIAGPLPLGSASATAPGAHAHLDPFPSARTSNSASTESSITTRAVRDPAWPGRRAAGYIVDLQLPLLAATSVSAKSTTTAAATGSFMV